MQEGNWNSVKTMLSNGPEMSGIRQNQNQGAPRSQDDAMVGYFFQRPQSEVNAQYNSKRWAVGDDSVIEQVGSLCTQCLAMLGGHVYAFVCDRTVNTLVKRTRRLYQLSTKAKGYPGYLL